MLFKESGIAPQGSFEHIRDELDYSALTADDLTYRLGVPTNTAQGLVAGLQSSHPTPAIYPAPSVAAVTALCARDEVLDRWSFVSPYLLCYSYDTHAEGVRLFRAVGPGPTASFKLVRDTLGSKVFEAAYLTKFLGVPSKTADALVVGLHSSIQINPIVYPTPSIATIKHVCTHHDMVLGRWSFVSPYLLCYNYDEYTEGVGLYKESGPATNGSFRHIFGTGGEMNADFLIEAGVPSNTARALVSGLHS